MKIFLRIFLLSVFAISAGNVSYAQSTQTTAVPFLLISPDARGSGIGESGAGLADNSSAIFWNPAGAAFLTGTEVSLTHSNWLPQF
ncbi:MAG: hypothetical protein ACK4UV_02120, partial [Ignavibacterium sp.]